MYATAEDAMQSKSKQATNDIYDGTRRIREDVRTAADHVKEDVRTAASHVKQDIEDIARQVGTQTREFAGVAEKSVTDAAGNVVAKIRDNPVQSSAIALGTGIVLGLLLFRGR